MLKRPFLKEAAAAFPASHTLWLRFADAALPGDGPLLGESKKLISRKHKLFIEKGEAALPEIKKINQRQLFKEAETDFPLCNSQAADLRANLRDHILQIGATEKQAVDLLQSAIV